MTDTRRPLRYPVRVKWLNQSWQLCYHVLLWCERMFDDRFEVLHDAEDPEVATLIDFEREQDLMLFLLKWGKDGNGLRSS